MQNLALCFPSALRRESLFSAISSLLSHEVNANIEVGIYTDNPSATPPFVKEGIEGLKKKGVFCTLHCLEKRKETIENLARNFDKELLNYALLPPEDGIGYGVNVNTSMLGSAGSILISCDDDIISKPARIKPALLDALLEKMPSADKKEGDDDRLLLYFTNRESLLDAVEEVDVNILQAYFDLFRQNEEKQRQDIKKPNTLDKPRALRRYRHGLCPGHSVAYWNVESVFAPRLRRLKTIWRSYKHTPSKHYFCKNKSYGRANSFL